MVLIDGEKGHRNRIVKKDIETAGRFWGFTHGGA